MEFKEINLTRIRTVRLSDLSVHDSFFDSLRSDYKEFNEWFARVSTEGRKAWIVDTGNENIDTLCVYKVESSGEHIDDSGSTLPGRFLKLCTFKVTTHGYRFGERLLYAAFQFALNNGLNYVYVQVSKTGHEQIKKLLNRFGFNEGGSYKNDRTYIKELKPDPVPFISIDQSTNFRYCQRHYPYHLDGCAIRKFLISLDPGTHEHLFPDSKIQNLPLEAHEQGLAKEVNAIRKAIAQNEILEGLRPSDILLFYRQSTDASLRGYIDHLGIIESLHNYSTYDAIEEDIRDCLPYTEESLCNLLTQGKRIQIVVFWLVQSIQAGIKRIELSARGYDTNHRRVRRIPNKIYKELIKPMLSPYGVSNQKPFNIIFESC